MKIYSNLQNFSVTNPIVTIGTFDGIHLGHRSVINSLLKIARSEKGNSVIFTFDPHPRQVVAPRDHKIQLLTTPEEKTNLLSELGIEHLIIYPFTRRFASMNYHDFVEKILVNKIHISHLVIGYDHHFGKNREGSFDSLSQCAKEFGFKVTHLGALEVDHINISSTKIRNALNNGDIDLANEYLGYSYILSGTVVKGNQIGRTIGFPTANIRVSNQAKLIPPSGVYAVKVKINDSMFPGILNIGTRPTLFPEETEKSIEVNIFNFDGILYNKELTVCFEKKIRDEKKFENIDSLKQQIEFDKIIAMNLLKDLI